MLSDHLPIILAEIAAAVAKDASALEVLLRAAAAWQPLGLDVAQFHAAYRREFGGGTSGRDSGPSNPAGASTAEEPCEDPPDDKVLLAALDDAIAACKKSDDAVALAEEHGGFEKIPVSQLGDLLAGARVWSICARLSSEESERQARIALRRAFAKLTTPCFDKQVGHVRRAIRRAEAEEEISEGEEERLRIDSGYAEPHAVDDALGFLSRDRGLYVQRVGHGDTLVATRPSMTWGSVTVRSLSDAGVADRLPRFARVVAINRDGEIKSAHVPRWLCQLVRDRGHYPGFRRLVGVTTVPLLGPDGKVIGSSGPGWDRDTCYLYAPDLDYVIPRGVSLGEIEAARNRILAYVSEFPWASPASRSAWFAGLITTFVRPAIRGPCPLFLCDGNLRGVGKTMLARLIGIARTGRNTPLLKWSKEEELQKSLLSALRGLPAIVNIDNLRGFVESMTLEALLTSLEFRCRLLGTNTDAIIEPMHTVIFATANNATLSTDLVRRALPIRIEADTQAPERRIFNRNDLDGDFRANRKQIVEDVLRCVVGYVEAGSPAVPLVGAFGSYEHWDLVRRMCCWLGLGDPVASREGWTSGAQDNETESIATVYRFVEMTAAEMVSDPLGGAPKPRGFATAALLHDYVRREEIMPTQSVHDGHAGLRDALVELCSGHREPGPKAIGRALRRIQAYPLGRKRLRSRDDGHGTLQWWIESNE